jgi:hypothetical protein
MMPDRRAMVPITAAHYPATPRARRSARARARLLTTDHPDAAWYRGRPCPDWPVQVRCSPTATREVDVVIRPDAMAPQPPMASLARGDLIIATAIRAGQRHDKSE